MNVLVVYGSKHGSTQGIAERIAETLRTAGHQAAVRPVEAGGELAGYDAFVVGSAVYAGHWTPQATESIRRHQALLASRPVWLFSSGPIGTMATKYELTEPKGIGAAAGGQPTRPSGLLRRLGPQQARPHQARVRRAAGGQTAPAGGLPRLGHHPGVGRRYRPRAGLPVSQPPRGLRHPKEDPMAERIRTRIEHLVDTRSARLGAGLLRLTKGHIARLWRRQVLILTTRGRRSGKERTVPLQYFPDGEAMAVVAANSGLPSPPGWYFNLIADPRARVEVGGRRLAVRAEELSAEEAAAFWPRVLQVAPDYARYPRRTSGRIPLLRLVPTIPATASDASSGSVGQHPPRPGADPTNGER